IQVAVDPSQGADALVQPGHVFPLRARRGGVLERTGQTEAAVDLARLAGLQPAGVVCEVMKDDGTMARVDDLIPYCREHGLKLVTVADLIEYRRRREQLVERADTRSRSEEHTSELQLRGQLVWRLLLEKKKNIRHGKYAFQCR